MVNTYKTNSHCKYLIQFHLVLVCKYRYKLLNSQSISLDIKNLSKDICKNNNVIIRYMETDKDHIHYLLECSPQTNISNIIRTLKSYTTYHIWKKYKAYLIKAIRNKHVFWSSGYFITSVGNVSSDIIKEYIENQGK